MGIPCLIFPCCMKVYDVWWFVPSHLGMMPSLFLMRLKQSRCTCSFAPVRFRTTSLLLMMGTMMQADGSSLIVVWKYLKYCVDRVSLQTFFSAKVSFYVLDELGPSTTVWYEDSLKRIRVFYIYCPPHCGTICFSDDVLVRISVQFLSEHLYLSSAKSRDTYHTTECLVITRDPCSALISFDVGPRDTSRRCCSRNKNMSLSGTPKV